MSLRDEIKACKVKPKLRPIEVPEWNDRTVYLRLMSTQQLMNSKDLFKEAETGRLDSLDRVVELICSFVCDEDGEPIFNFDDDKDFLLSYDLPFLGRFITEYFDFSGMVKEAEKN